MRLWQPILNALVRTGLVTRTESPATPQPSAAYGSPFESANYSSKRGRLPGFSGPQDASLDMSPDTRNDMLEKTRYGEKNSGLMRGMIRDNRTYAVGTGITPQSNSTNVNAGKRAVEMFGQMARNCDISGRFSMAECQRMISQALDVDGEIFVLKVIHPITKEPKIQLVETHRVGDFGKGDTQDGIGYDKFSAPLFYRVLEDDGGTVDVPASQVLHIFDPERPSMARAFSPLQHGANNVVDAIELLAIEKGNVKTDGDVVRTITTQTGALDNDDFDTPGAPVVEGSNARGVQNITGGKVVTLAPGESVDSYVPQRPSPTFTGFLTHLDRDTTLGNVPYEFTANPAGINGTAIRLVTTKADRIFGNRQDVLIERFITPVWFFFIGYAINNGRMKAFVKWWDISCVTPRKLTTDASRDSAANRADVEMGLKTLSDHFAENGTTFQAEMIRRADEAEFMLKLAKERGIPLEMLFRPSNPTPTPASGTPPTTKPAPPAK